MKKLNIDKDDFVIIYAGRLVPEKGVKELAKTVMSINNSKIKLMILGTSLFAEGENTDYTNEIARIAKASNGRIIGTGFVHNNIIANYFAIARLCVVPSMCEEALALVPLEAMTSGVPVIITNSGGMVEYVKNGYPLVVNRGNMFCEQLVEYILKMYNNPVFCDELKSKGIDRSLDFSRIKFYNDFIKIFDK
ncbi:MAG: glycosyltransferase family 4 protein [Lachnospirales bacterium]